MAAVNKNVILRISKTSLLLPVILLCLALGLVFGYSPLIGIGLLGCIGLTIFLFYNTELGIIIALFAVPFDKLAKITPEGTLTVAKVLIILTILAWFTKKLLSKDDKLAVTPFYNIIGILGIAFLIVSFVSIINASDKTLWFSQQLRRTNVIILYMLLIGIIDNRGLLKKALWAILLSGFFISLIGIYELLTHTPILSFVGIPVEIPEIEEGRIRIIGPTGDPDFHAASIILFFSIAMYFFYIGRSKLLKVGMIIFLSLLLINIFGTGSRGGLIGLILAFGIFWYFATIRHKLIKTLLLGSLVTLFILFFIFAFPAAPTTRLTGEIGEKTFAYRIGWTEMGLQMVKDHPVFGIGTGNFLEAYNRYLVPTVPKDPHLPHNSFLQAWVENGTLAFFIYIAIYVFAIKNFWNVVQNSKEKELQPMALVLSATIFGFGFFALTSNVLENENYWILFAFSVIILNLYRNEK